MFFPWHKWVDFTIKCKVRRKILWHHDLYQHGKYWGNIFISLIYIQMCCFFTKLYYSMFGILHKFKTFLFWHKELLKISYILNILFFLLWISMKYTSSIFTKVLLKWTNIYSWDFPPGNITCKLPIYLSASDLLFVALKLLERTKERKKEKNTENSKRWVLPIFFRLCHQIGCPVDFIQK